PNQPADLTPKSRRFSVQEYRQYTDYVSRVNSILGEGTYHRRTAVLHPIVSVWANFTPPTRSMYEPHPSERVRFIDDSFASLCRELIQHQVEFDIVDEKNLAAARIEGKTLVIGEHAYDIVVLPPMDTIRLRTLASIHQFAQQGGSVLAYPLHPQFAAEGFEKDAEIKKMMAAIIAKGPEGGVNPQTTPIHYLVRSRVPPLCHLTPSSTHLLCTTISGKENLTFFLVNSSSMEYSGTFLFRSTGVPVKLDPATGEEKNVGFERVGDASIQIDASIGPYASVFVIFH
ncbi:hypothetical protein D4R75_00345, partial [bacterium]